MSRLKIYLPVLATLLICGAGWLTSAQAQQADMTQLLFKFVQSDGYLSSLSKTVPVAEPPPLRATCSNMIVIDANSISLIEPPTFSKVGTEMRVEGGAWISTVKVDRCGETVTRRFLVHANDGNLDYTALLPGDFHGDLTLEQDAKKLILPGLMNAAKCTDMAKVFVLNVHNLSPVTPTGWSESWTASTCGTLTKANIKYVIGGGEVTISGSDFGVQGK